ncbi:MAG TPA: site-2 protease family protein [Chthonomonadaceae bacterium]|nr:site-2 protease family protein [Chthonomonadaceae bacterium]
MRNSLRIARIFGIDINIDWSWLIIFMLIIWQLGAFVFRVYHPSWSAGMIWGTSVIAALLFFGSVLAHELAHSVVAIAKGLPVKQIILFVFGGVSNIQREPSSAGDEFQIAIVGPLMSFVIGAVCLAIGVALGGPLPLLSGDPLAYISHLGPVATILMWLGSINIVLGVFNLIPGFPLDGGRVLRSTLWAATGNLRRATVWAAGISHLVAWLFIVCGVLMIFGAQIPFFGTGLAGGAWLIFIGWFLNNAATASYRQVVIHDVLEGIPVARLMRPEVRSVPPDIPVSMLVYDYLMRSDERAFPVAVGDQLLGLVGMQDVQKIPREAWDTTPVREIMVPATELEVATPEEAASDALNTLATSDIAQVPVLNHGHLVGVLRRRDVVKWLQMHADRAA